MLKDDMDTPLYMIGIVAQMLGIHPQTLRLYEREGLVIPGRSHGNTRLYSGRDVERLRFILHLTRDMGVNLAGIEIILRMRDQVDQMQREMGDLMLYIKEELRKEISRFEEKPGRTEKVFPKGRPKKVIRVRFDKGG